MIIGVVGYIGSGKDTISNILMDNASLTKVSFADPVKDVVAATFGWDREMLQGDTKHSREAREVVDEWWSDKLDIENFTPRMALQVIGTDLFRDKFNQAIWVNSCLASAKQHKNVIITDVRFMNEANLIKSEGGILIRVTRGKKMEWYDTAALASQGDKHAITKMREEYPEVHSSDWAPCAMQEDFHVKNDGTLGDLKLRAIEVLGSLEIKT